MTESEALVRLQEIDLALIRHRRNLAAMPQVKKLATIDAARKKLASEVAKAMGQRKDLEMDLAENERKHKRCDEIVLEIQGRYESGEVSYREVADLEAQLSIIAKRVEKYTYQHGELEKRLEAARGRERDFAEMDQRLLAEAQAQTAAYKEHSAGIAREVRALTEERDEVVRHLSDDVLERYRTAAKRFQGLAVETVKENGRPSVCCVTISPSSYEDLRRGPAIGTCPYCHRMLVTEGMQILTDQG